MSTATKIILELTPEQQETIRLFWSRAGATNRAMLAQPKLRDGKYSLHVRMLDEELADKAYDLLNP